MNEKQKKAWAALVSCDSVTVLEALTNYHGLQILSDGFIEHLIDEGIMEEEVNDEQE